MALARKCSATVSPSHHLRVLSTIPRHIPQDGQRRVRLTLRGVGHGTPRRGGPELQHRWYCCLLQVSNGCLMLRFVRRVSVRTQSVTIGAMFWGWAFRVATPPVCAAKRTRIGPIHSMFDLNIRVLRACSRSCVSGRGLARMRKGRNCAPLKKLLLSAPCCRLSDGERLASTQLPGQVFSSPVCCAIPRKAHRPVAAPTLPSQQDRSCLGIGADSVRVLVGSRDNYLYGLSLSARELN